MADVEAHITGTVWKIECEVGQTALMSPDTIEGPLAFAQKRAPKFVND